MAVVKINYRNILESGTVTVTTEDAAYPKYRLYDRDIGKLFKGTAFASPFAIVIDQGAVTSYPVNRLIIPIGHNLNGLACSLRYSTDNFSGDDHEAVGWTQGDALAIDKSFTEQTKQYWKLNVTAPATIVEMPEMFLSKDYQFQRNIKPGVGEELKRNIVRTETLSGRVRKVKLGEERYGLTFDLGPIDSTQKADLELWNASIDGVKSFYVRDHNGVLNFMEMLNDLSFVNLTSSLWTTRFELLEVL